MGAEKDIRRKNVSRAPISAPQHVKKQKRVEVDEIMINNLIKEIKRGIKNE